MMLTVDHRLTGGRQRRRISGPFAHDSRTADIAGRGRPAGQPWSLPPDAR